jgi:hypothetical protein
MTDETAQYGTRLRDLEAFAFRTRNATTAPENRTIEQRLGAIEHLLSALARAQGIDPTAG